MSRAGIIGLIVGALVLVVGVGVFAFALGGAGGEAAAASAMPADTEVYMSVDLVNMRPVSRLMDAFSEGMEGVADSPDNLLDELDRQLSAELGVTLDDIEAWVGRDAALGVRDLRFDEFGLTSQPDVIVAVSIDDTAGVAGFMDDVRGRVEREMGVTFDTTRYEGVDIYSTGAVEEFGVAVAYAISGDVLLLGTSVAAIQDSVDAQSGDSLADDAGFQEMIDALPGSAGMTMYMSGSFFRQVARAAETAQSADALPPEFADALEALRSMGMSIAIIDEGVRVDFAVLADEGALAAVDEQLAGFGVGGNPTLHERFPENTLVYLASSDGLASIWDSLREAVAGTSDVADLDGFLREAEAQLGFDLETDLIDLLDGEMGFALVRSFRGIIADQLGFDLGVIGAFGTSDAAGLRSAIEAVNDLLGDTGLDTSRVEAEGTFYSAADSGTELFAYGAGGDFAVIASSGDAIRDFFGDGPRLSENATFRKARSALAGDTPVLFVDIAGLVAVFDAPSELRGVLEPLQGAALAGTSDGELTRASLVVLIDFPE